MDRRVFLKTGSAAAAGLAPGTLARSNPPGFSSDAGSKYLILACDGGGLRGYLSSLILQKLNQELGIFGTNNQNIDFYAGTSTGGLIALGLAYGKNIDSVVELYQTSGSKIFTPSSVQAPCLSSVPTILKDATSNLRELWQVLYDDIGVQSVRSVIEDFIPGNPTLSSLPNRVMVATFQLAASLETGTSWNPLIIDNLDDSTAKETYLYDAALSTSAAPVYFPPYQHPTFGWCSDGGLFANNPAPQAVARAIETGWPISKISLLSIGTGFINASISVSSEQRLCYGLKNWVWLKQNGPTPPFPLLNGIMAGVSATNDYLCSQLLGSRYLRVNPVLDKAVTLDDYSASTMQLFESTANNLFKSEEWTVVKDWVTTNFRELRPGL